MDKTPVEASADLHKTEMKNQSAAGYPAVPQMAMLDSAPTASTAITADSSSATMKAATTVAPMTTMQLPSTSLSPTPAPIPIPRFLQQLFAQEGQRRVAAPPCEELPVVANTAVTTQDGCLTSHIKQAHCSTSGIGSAKVLPHHSQYQQSLDLCQDSNLDNQQLDASMEAVADLSLSPGNTSNSQIPGLVYSAGSTASSDTSNFPADAVEGDLRPATPATALASFSSVSGATPSGSNTRKPYSAHYVPYSYSRSTSYSTYDYASSASSVAGDEICPVGQSEAGSTASRSTSPAGKSVTSNSHSVGNNSYSSPSTSPFFHNTGFYQANQNHHGSYFHPPHHQSLHLLPLKLPPPSLDLYSSESTNVSSSTTPNCDSLNVFPANGFRYATSPSGSGIPTASTSQTTTPGFISPEGTFSPGRTHRSRQQHYSPLHPFHQQGFMSPQRSRSVINPLGILATRDPADPELQDEHSLKPPDNFAMVSSGVYRSSFPSQKNFEFLKTLGLKTVLTLVQEEEYPQSNRDFFKKEKIRFVQIGIPGNKEPFVTIPDDKIRRALSIVLDKRNHPLLIHCNKGKHRTGCLVGCLRKMQCWSSTTIFEEYRRFSFPKSRAMDQLFIELFQPDWTCVEIEHLPVWCQGEDAGLSGRLAVKARANVVNTVTVCPTVNAAEQADVAVAQVIAQQ